MLLQPGHPGLDKDERGVVAELIETHKEATPGSVAEGAVAQEGSEVALGRRGPRSNNRIPPVEGTSSLGSKDMAKGEPEPPGDSEARATEERGLERTVLSGAGMMSAADVADADAGIPLGFPSLPP